MLVEISPTLRRLHEMMENWLSNSHQNAMAESTVGTMKGISTTARSIALNGRFSFSRIAR